MRILFAVIALCLLMASAAVAADPMPMPPELLTFLMQPSEKRAAMYNIEQQWKRSVENCPKSHLDRSNVSIIKPPEFDAEGVPTSGVWRVVDQVSGCDQHRTLSLLYYFGDDGKMMRASLLPGTTVADPALQREAVMYANTAMRIMIPDGCKNIQYMDTEFSGFGEGSPVSMLGHEGRAWTERWTLNACGVKGLVTMHFSPTAMGTTISANADETKLLNGE